MNITTSIKEYILWESSCQRKPENDRLASCILANIKVSPALVHLGAALRNADGSEKANS